MFVTEAKLPNGAVDYRYTMFREHVQERLFPPVAEHDDNSSLASSDPVNEILSVRQIRLDVGRKWKKKQDDAGNAVDAETLIKFRKKIQGMTSPEIFFYGKPDQTLYHHVPIFEKSPPSDRKALEGTELSQFLAEKNLPGVLLTARSGSGKTVASWKAFFDCFYARPEESQTPILSGAVPCWVSPDESSESLSELRTAMAKHKAETAKQKCLKEGVDIAKNAVLESIAAAVNSKNPVTPEQCEQWLKHGPPLLLFFDLNHISHLNAQIIARGIVQLLEEHQSNFKAKSSVPSKVKNEKQAVRGMDMLLEADEFAGGKSIAQGEIPPLSKNYTQQQSPEKRPALNHHRCVVTYRSTDTQDAVLEILQAKNNHFTSCDLKPLSTDVATRYLRNFRGVERQVDSEFDLLEVENTDKQVEQECELLTKLINSTTHSYRDPATGEEQAESLISTPLLMHWVSLLRRDALKRVESLSDLYREVVQQHLQREISEGHHELLLVAMVRIALAMQANNELRLERIELEDILESPDDSVEEWGLPEGILRGKSKPNSYHERPFSKEERDLVLRHGLLRKDTDKLIGFMHDSLAYYFTTIALRYYRKPQMPKKIAVKQRDQWADAVTELFTAEPKEWELVADFLGGMLRTEGEYTALAERLIATDGIEGLPQLFLRLTTSAKSHDTIAKALHQSHHRRNWWSLQNPKMFCEELYERLLSSRVDGANASAARIAERRNEIGTSWLRLMHPRPQSNLQIMEKHQAKITAMIALPDDRIASGDTSGTVYLWDPNSDAEAKIIIQHDGGDVVGLAVLSDGRVVSGSDDKTVRLWDPASNAEPEKIIQHDSWVTALGVLPDGRVVSGSDDRTVRLWDPTSDTEPAVIIQHDRSVHALSVLPDGRVVSGSGDNTVRLWNPVSNAEPPVIIKHGYPVVALSVLPDGRIVSGSFNGTVRLWDPASNAESIVIIQHQWKVDALSVLPDGRLVSVSGYTMGLWDPNYPDGEVSEISLSIPSTALAVLPDGRVVLGSQDGTVRLWNPAYPDDYETTTIHHGGVTALAVLENGYVVSGSNDRTVCQWNPAQLPVIQARGAVSALVVLSDGSVVSGGYSSSVRLWDPTHLEVIRIYRPQGSHYMLALTLLSNGYVVMVDSEGIACLWDPIHPEKIENLFRLYSIDEDEPVHFQDFKYPEEAETISEQYHGYEHIRSLAVLPNGHVALGTASRGIYLWNPTHPDKEVTKFSQYSHWPTVDRVSALSVLPDGRVISGSQDLTVRLWNPAQPNAEPAVIIQHRDLVTALAVLSDDRVVSGSNDGTVRLWDPAQPEAVEIIQHEGAVRTLSVLPDGRVVSGSYDKTVRLWSPQQDCVTSQLHLREEVFSLAVDKKRSRLVVGLGNGEVLFFAVEPGGSLVELSGED